MAEPEQPAKRRQETTTIRCGPSFVVKSPTPKKKEVPRLEIHGEDGDGRSRCVFWRGEAEAAAELVEVGAVVSCVVQRSDCDGAVDRVRGLPRLEGRVARATRCHQKRSSVAW